MSESSDAMEMESPESRLPLKSATPVGQPTGVREVAEDHLSRLEREARDVQRIYAYHPYVRVEALEGDPPTEYQVTYRVRTVQLDEQGVVQWLERVEMHVWLPPEYPRRAPLFRPLSAVFHPNVAPDGVTGLPRLDPRMPLSQWITQVGFLLAYRTFNPQAVADAEALDWAQDNQESLPTDPQADFFPEAGGDALTRISEKGGKTLAKIRRSLEQTCDALLQEVPPPEEEIYRYCQATRRLTPLFLEADIPQDLRDAATDLDETARRLPEALAQFDIIRRQHVAVSALAREAQEAQGMTQRLDVRCAEFEGAFKLNVQDDIDALEALKQIPELTRLKPWDQELADLIEKAKRWAQSFRARQQSLEKDVAIETGFGALLDQRLLGAVARIQQGASPAQGEAADALAVLEPALDRAVTAAAGLRRCIEWRAYGEALERGMTLHNRLSGRDISVMQSLYIDTSSGSFGPFEMEQRVTLGSTAVVVRSLGRRSMELLDAKKGRLLARSDDGKLSLQLKDDQSGENYPYTFRVTNRCDDLRVQIELAIKRSSDLLSRLNAPIDTGNSQFGRLARVLEAPQAREMFENRQRESEELLASLARDLASVEPLKERLATYFLVKRCAEMIPDYVARMQKARAIVRQAMARISYIEGHSVKDKSGKMVVPAQYAKEYAQHVLRRDQISPEVERLQNRINVAVGMIQQRLLDEKLWGAAAVPVLKVLAPISPEMRETIAAASDQNMLDVILKLEQVLNVSLRPPSWLQGAEADEQDVEEESRVLIESQEMQTMDHTGDAPAEPAPDNDHIPGWPGVE